MSNGQKLIYTDLTFSKIPKIQEKIDAIKSLEKIRMFLYKEFASQIDILEAIEDKQEIIELLKEEVNPFWKSEFNGTRIKINIPDILPTIYIKTTNEAAGYFVEQWKRNLSNSIRNLKEYPSLKFNQVFIWIKIFNPLKFDGDNKIFKPIIDGICRSGIIKEDSCEIVKFGVDARKCSKDFHTEVYIFGDNNIPEFVSKDMK